MSFTFSEKPAIRFKLTGDHLKTLLSGDMVRIEETSGEPVEFFMSDIGVDLMADIAQKEFKKLNDNLTQISIKPV